MGTDRKSTGTAASAAIALLSLLLGACSASTEAGHAGAGGATQGGGTALGGGLGSGGRMTGGATGAGGGSESGGSGSGGGQGRGGAAGVADSGGATTGGALGRGGVSAGGTVTGGATGTGGIGGAGGQPDAGSPRDTKGNDSASMNAEDAARDAATSAQADAATNPTSCPSTSTLKTGDNKSTLQFGGRTRSYVVYLPSSIKAGMAVPLVFDFHGHGANASQEESSSGWKKKADQSGFIVVYPEGVDSSWNVGSCCGLAMSENVDDVGFTRAMIEAVSKAACIDAKRIYATGMSNGAGFTQRLACEAADVIAAIAAASADLVTDPCVPARPISELSIRGLSDTMVAYAGGKTGSTGWYSPGAEGTLALWKTIDQCTGSPQATHQYCETYTSCGAGVEIGLCSLPNTGHDTYNNAVGMNVPDVAWEMFQRQPMP
jgi:polyhydroxybutyrate depolymerase